MSYPERRLEPDKAWKVVYEVSHAPYYVIQLPNNHFVGCYAPVEIVDGDNSVPFGLKESTLLEYQQEEHIDITVHEKSQTPFNTGVYYDRVIPSGQAWLFTFSDTLDGVQHAVIQLENGTFLSNVNREEPDIPVGVSKEKVLSKKTDSTVPFEEVPISQTPFQSVNE